MISTGAERGILTVQDLVQKQPQHVFHSDSFPVSVLTLVNRKVSCKDCSSDGKGSWQLGAKENHKVPGRVATYRPAQGKGFLKCSNSALAEEGFHSERVTILLCSAQLWLCSKLLLLCCAPFWQKKIVTQTSFKRFIRRDESRRGAASARVGGKATAQG